MSTGMVPQWIRGQASRQAHADLPPGTIEEEHALEGFDGPASHLYRTVPLTGWTHVEGPFRPRLLAPYDHTIHDTELPVELLGNDLSRIGYWSLTAGQHPIYSDADGDILYFVHQGEGVLATEYGPLNYSAGDYLLVPKSTLHNFEVSSGTWLYTIQALADHYRIPERGLLGRHALFDPAALEVPTPQPRAETGDFPIRVVKDRTITTYHFEHHPYNAIGWKGDLAPVRLNLSDIRPVVSERYHMPPPVHTTFVAKGVIVSSWVPRPLENDEGVPRVPFHHRNVDCDEVTFMHRGQFFSRDDMGLGIMTFHPGGVFHGPTPGARERSNAMGNAPRTSEWVVGLEVYAPLTMSSTAHAVEREDYIDSWQYRPAAR